MVSEKTHIHYQLDTLRIFVRDLNEAMAFYKQLLGIPIRSFNEDLGWAELDLGEGVTIRLEWIYPFADEFQVRVGRFLGISLSVDDLESSFEKLTEKGVVFVKEPQKHTSGILVAHLQDPSGNVLTLVENPG
ncbi:MAG: VOC family protein [Bacteroidota bacterium]